MKLDPLTRAFLDCLHESEAMSRAVACKRPAPVVATLPPPCGPRKCCRCGREPEGKKRPTACPSWVVAGEHCWCHGCKRTKQGLAQIRAAREQAKVPAGALPAGEVGPGKNEGREIA